MLRKLRFVIAGILIVAANQAVSLVVAAAVPTSLLPPGTTRYAMVSATDSVTTTSYPFVDVPGLSTSIRIPSGKRADVAIFFCGVVWSGSELAVRALVGSGAAAPLQAVISPYTGFDPGNFGQSRCFNFYKTGVGAGTKTVKMQWEDFDSMAATQQMKERSMIVVVNIR